VRGRLEAWTAPDVDAPITLGAALFADAPPVAHARPRDRWRALREVPVWAQVAAALLVFGVSAGVAGAIANLEVRYTRDGVSVRTGWSRSAGDAAAPTAPSPLTVAQAASTGAAAATPWTGDLDALEKRLRTVIRESSAATASAVAARNDAASTSEAQLLRRVRALVEDSERKQRNELALKIAEVVEEFDAKRGSDLASLRSMRTIQTATSTEIARQQQWINLLTRTSMQK
jgi:hypothetical protein